MNSKASKALKLGKILQVKLNSDLSCLEKISREISRIEADLDSITEYQTMFEQVFSEQSSHQISPEAAQKWMKLLSQQRAQLNVYLAQMRARRIQLREVANISLSKNEIIGSLLKSGPS